MHTPTPKQEVVSGSSKSSGHHCGILEEEEHWLEVRRKYAREIVSSPRFDGTIAVIIALNAFAITLSSICVSVATTLLASRSLRALSS